MNTHKQKTDVVRLSRHGSDANRFVRGAWPGCVCGHKPRDNKKLIDHFAEHGFEEIDDHGRIVRRAVQG